MTIAKKRRRRITENTEREIPTGKGKQTDGFPTQWVLGNHQLNINLTIDTT
ncbi:MAG TPA: hypothetical protein VEQ18_05550 [Candidatus Nitrosocosmicus sp.]|nr:hypothetical protein [Candidatus Nitrosocosmicus sp.]